MKNVNLNNTSSLELMNAEFPSITLPNIEYTFDDYVLCFLAKMAKNNDLLTYRSYEALQKALQSIFLDSALHAGLQSKIHYFLLNNTINNEEIVSNLIKLALKENISEDFIERFIQSVNSIQDEYLDDEAKALRQNIAYSFAKEEFEKNHFNPKKYAASLLQNNLVQNLLKIDFKSKRKINSKESYEIVSNLLNDELAQKIKLLDNVAWNLQDEELSKKIIDFKKIMIAQKFRVLVLGESKRGKSSLINAFLAKELSPMRESITETSCILEFSYSERTEYEVFFLDEFAYQYLDSFIAQEQDNLLLKHYIESIRQDFASGLFSSDEVKVAIQNIHQLKDYVSIEGKYSRYVSKVRISMPIDFLKSGLVLVDSPGINDINKFHDYLSFEESIKADLVLFLIDARNPCTRSELSFLRTLAKAGRLINIIGVITHADKLNEGQKTLINVREKARLFLLEAIRQVPSLQLLGLVELNPRELLKQRTSHIKTDPAFAELLILIDQAQKNSSEKTAYQKRVSANANELFALASERSVENLHNYKKSLPDAKFLELLDRHATSLASGVEKYVAQAQNFLRVAASDVDIWRNTSLVHLEDFEKLLLSRLMQASSEKMLTLGKNFAKEEEWKDFDNEVAVAIVQELLDDYAHEQTKSLQAWDEKINIFAEDIDKLAELCLEQVEADAKHLHDICKLSSNKEHLLVKANDYMRKLAIFSVGAMSGASISMGLIQILTLGLATLSIISNPLFLFAAGAGGIGIMFLHFQGNEEKVRKAFLERKEKKYQQYVKNIRIKLEEDILSIQLNIAERYKLTVLRSFIPVLEIMCNETVNLNLYLKVIDKISNDADIYSNDVQKTLENLASKKLV